MKHLIAISGIALALVASSAHARAEASPPPLPALTPEQSQDMQARLDTYRRATDARVARGEITGDEAARLLQWREWQLAQQAAGKAPEDVRTSRAPVYADAPPDYYEPRPPDDYVVEPAYGPYYRYGAPYYWGPRPYAYWGPSVCAGGFGRHFGGRICF